MLAKLSTVVVEKVFNLSNKKARVKNKGLFVR
jgi:hypothetical protein